MTATCDPLNATVIALGGTEDHVHLLLRVPPTVDVSSLVKRLKGGFVAFDQSAGALPDAISVA